MQWVYEGARAPGGIKRMTVDFGLLTPQRLQADAGARSSASSPSP